MANNQALREKRAHLIMAFVWALLIIPTILWWKNSILWVLVISIYANFVGHLSGYQAARAEINSPDAPEE